MVTDDQDAAVVAENAQSRQRDADLTTPWRAALERIAARETPMAARPATKTPPPSVVKAHGAERPAKARVKRAAEHQQGRARQTATRTVVPGISHWPDRGTALGGGQVGRTRHPPPRRRRRRRAHDQRRHPLAARLRDAHGPLFPGRHLAATWPPPGRRRATPP